MKPSRIKSYAPFALLAGTVALGSLAALSAGLALARAREELQGQQERLAGLRSRSVIVDELKAALASAKEKDASSSGFFVAADSQQLNALFQRRVTEAAAAERGQILSINLSQPRDENGVQSLRLETSLSLPRDRIEAFAVALEASGTPVFFEDMRLDARNAETNGTVQTQARLRGFGIIPEAK